MRLTGREGLALTGPFMAVSYQGNSATLIASRRSMRAYASGVLSKGRETSKTAPGRRLSAMTRGEQIAEIAAYGADAQPDP